jgi:hypothetical protein
MAAILLAQLVPGRAMPPFQSDGWALRASAALPEPNFRRQSVKEYAAPRALRASATRGSVVGAWALTVCAFDREES